VVQGSRLEREIMGLKSEHKHLAEERGQVAIVEREDETGRYEACGGGEEMMYSGVVRSFKRFKAFNATCDKGKLPQMRV
jgi:PAB1-binding protein PBP1